MPISIKTPARPEVFCTEWFQVSKFVGVFLGIKRARENFLVLLGSGSAGAALVLLFLEALGGGQGVVASDGEVGQVLGVGSAT